MADASPGVALGGGVETARRRRLRQLGLDLRPGEGGPAALLFVCLFLLLTFQIATKTVRQSTFIDSLGAARLPLVYLLVAITSYPVLRLYNRLSDRFRIEQLLTVSCLIVAAGLFGFWVLMAQQWAWVAIVFYVFSSIVYGMLTSQFWLFANHAFDPRQARRLFGFITAGALLGGIVGGQVARVASRSLGTGSVLLVAAGLLVLVAVLLGRAAARGAVEPVVVQERRGRLDDARGGFAILRDSRPLRTIAAGVVLSIMVAQIVDLQFNWAVEQTTSGLDQRTAFYGNFFSVMGIAALFFQLLFTSRIHRTLGIGFALRVLPIAMAAGTAALLLAAGLFPELVIAAALTLKIGESGLRYSLDGATRELLFLPVPSRLRIKAKAVIDVFVEKGAKGLAALLLLPVTFGLLTVVQVGWLSLVLVAVWLAVIVFTAREYVEAFRAGLKQRSVDTAIPVDLSDLATLELLLESLGSSDRRQVLHSLDILIANRRADLVPPLLLYHDDPEVRRRTLMILAEAGRVDVAPLIERRLGDGDPDVQAEAIRVLAGMQGKNICELMLPKLDESEPGVRAAAVACIANHGDAEMLRQACQVLQDLLTDEEPASRAEAAKAIGAVHEPRFQEHLIQLLYDPDQQVVRQSIAAVRRRVTRDGFNPLYIPTLISLLRDRRVKHEAREALVAFGEPAIPPLVHFMNDVEEAIWVRRALPKAIARIGTLAAGRALLEGLESGEDSLHRRKLIEALTSIRDSRVLWQQETARIGGQIAAESRRCLAALAALDGLGLIHKGTWIGGGICWQADQVPTLLDQLLQEQTEAHLRNVFGLLTLLHDADQIWSAYRSLTSGQKMLRARALEFLDNTLVALAKRHVFAVIDDCPLSDKLERAERQYGIAVESKPETLRRFLVAAGETDTDSGALAAAALYAVHQERVRGLEDEIGRLVGNARDPFVRETAVWIADRMRLGPYA